MTVLGGKASVPVAFILAVVAAVFDTPALAHHAAPTEYDVGRPIVLRGTLVKMLWSNPHGWMYIDIKGDEAVRTQWMVETGAPNALLRLGWRRSDVVPGTELIIHAYPARNGKLEAHASRVTFPDGRVLVSDTSPPPSRDGLRYPITK